MLVPSLPAISLRVVCFTFPPAPISPLGATKYSGKAVQGLLSYPGIHILCIVRKNNEERWEADWWCLLVAGG